MTEAALPANKADSRRTAPGGTAGSADMVASAPSPPHSVPWRRPLFVIAVLVAAGVAAVFTLLPAAPPPGSGTAGKTATEPLSLEFKDGTGAMRNLAQFRGKALLVNFWATWCAPCREEMPALDRLQEKLGSRDFEVIALSLDRGGPERVSQFLREIGNRNLTLYIADMAVARGTVGVFGLPLTLLLDRDGREVHRVVGPAAWDSPAMIAEVGARLGVTAPPVPAEADNAKP